MNLKNMKLETLQRLEKDVKAEIAKRVHSGHDHYKVGLGRSGWHTLCQGFELKRDVPLYDGPLDAPPWIPTGAHFNLHDGGSVPLTTCNQRGG